MCDIVPDFDWKITRRPIGDIFVGKRVTISCFMFLGSTEGLTADARIFNPQGHLIPLGEHADRVRRYELVEIVAGFETVLQFSGLSTADEGTYTCSGAIRPEVSNPFLKNIVKNDTFDITLSCEFY